MICNKFTKIIVLILFAVFLNGCGTKNSSEDADVLNNAKVGLMADITSANLTSLVINLPKRLQIDLASTISNDDIFNWAESTYSSIFPPRETNKTLQPYTYRYYFTTNNYLAVDQEGGIWILGPNLTQGKIVQVGNLRDFANTISSWKSKISEFAVYRQADQVSFGANTLLLADIRANGFSNWINSQLSMATTFVDPEILRGLQQGNTNYFQYHPTEVTRVTVTAPDQLRQRVAWALSQYIVVSQAGGASRPYGLLQFYKMLQAQAFGNYKDLLREVTIHPTMGWYLDNGKNIRKGACENCAPSENYARELMQLFSIGVVQLNNDGTPKINNLGKNIDTYGPNDVSNLARALTGWEYSQCSDSNTDQNLLCFNLPMKVKSYNHDTGSKTFLGTTLPANQTTEKDLEDSLNIIFNHANLPPFVSKRLIQHLVMSNPSSAYISRVANIFINNGDGVRGDMKAVIKAILLDAEARQGDDYLVTNAIGGKIREPFLFTTAFYRALDCKSLPVSDTYIPKYTGIQIMWNGQPPLAASNVFSFYSPDHRAAKSSLLSPEQTMMLAPEYNRRFGSNPFYNEKELRDAGCNVDSYYSALNSSAEVAVNYMDTKFFKETMSSELRAVGLKLANLKSNQNIQNRAGFLMFSLLSSSEFGSIK